MDSKRNSPRLIGRKEASAYLGIAESTFSLWVSTHKLPPCIPGTRKWDRRAIDDRLDEISGLSSGASKEDEYERLTRESAERRERADRQACNDYDDWKQRKLKRREKYKPLMNLDAKLERILRFMGDHPECDTPDEIPLAGPTTMKDLVELGAVRIVGLGHGCCKYGLTDVGRSELHRLKKWKSLAP